jgi:hypothetical protein
MILAPRVAGRAGRLGPAMRDSSGCLELFSGEIPTMKDDAPSQARGEDEPNAQPDTLPPRRRWPPGWSETSRVGKKTVTRVFSYVDPKPDSVWVIEHDPDQGRFRVTGPDGKTMTFRDQPTRYLRAEPHAQTGEIEPALVQGSGGRPMDLYLCPEEREIP